MSTKIYDGCQIHVSTLEEYQEFVNDIKSVIVPELKLIILEKAAYYATSLIDKLNSGEAFECSQYDRFLGYGVDKYTQFCDEDKTGWSKEHSATIAVFMIKGKVLAIPFFGNSKIMKIFMAHDKVSEYGYWNNTDPLEDVSDEDWNQREADWNEALGGDGYSTPVEAGSMIVLDEPDYQFTSALSIKNSVELKPEVFEKINNRYLDKVKDRYIQKEVDLMFKDIEHQNTAIYKSEYYLKALELFKEFQKTPEYKKQCEKEKKNTLVITEELLRTKIKDFIDAQ